MRQLVRARSAGAALLLAALLGVACARHPIEEACRSMKLALERFEREGQAAFVLQDLRARDASLYTAAAIVLAEWAIEHPAACVRLLEAAPADGAAELQQATVYAVTQAGMVQTFEESFGARPEPAARATLAAVRAREQELRGKRQP